MKTFITSLFLLNLSQSILAICEINFTPSASNDDGFFAFENNSLPFMSGNGIDENILYVWDFGDGTSDSTYYTQSYGLHQYTAEGIYEVCLTEYYYVWGQFSCTASSCQTIEVDISSFGCDPGETPIEVSLQGCCNPSFGQFVSYAIYEGEEVIPANFVYSDELDFDSFPDAVSNTHCILPGCYVISFNYVKMFETPESLDINLFGNFSEEYQILETFQGYPSLISFCIEEPGINCATSIT
ncbi:MAG: PKD domain-containing protein, partial [Flavobacteriales bacterium]